MPIIHCFIIVLFCKMLGLLVICYLIEILLAVWEWERKGMGITNGNGKGMEMGIKLG